MQYVSTRGTAPMLGFADALLAGLARDGGLYAPLTLPKWRADDIRALRGLPYDRTAVRVMSEFVAGDFSDAELEAITADAYAGFRHAATAPLVQIEPNLFALELFHGPTLAFKDFAMQWLGRAMNRVLDDRDERATILGATWATLERQRSKPSADWPGPTSTFFTRRDACRTFSVGR